MSQLDVNVIAPLGYTGPNLPGNNNFVQVVDNNGDTVVAVNQSIYSLAIGGDNGSDVGQCIKIGRSAGFNITSNVGGGCIAIGESALSNASDTGNNLAVGNASLDSVNGTTGNSNVAIGTGSGASITSGSNNTLVGHGSGVAVVPLTVGINNTIIGYQACTAGVNSNNSVTLGNSAITTLRCAVTTITSLSDERDKKDIKDLSTGLEFVEALRPVEFTWNDRDESGKHNVADFGFIAQDLKKAQEDAEKAEVLKLVYEENPEKLEASYGKLIPILVKAIQELSEEVKQLKNK
jgi:hypothetical protein